METYLPSRFTSADYPRLVAAGQEVETIAVGAVMAVFNWEQGNPRHQKVSRFVDAFFSRFEDFQKPPRHPKWQEVSLTAQVPGWKRFQPAEDWLRRVATAHQCRFAPAPRIRHLPVRAAPGRRRSGGQSQPRAARRNVPGLPALAESAPAAVNGV